MRNLLHLSLVLMLVCMVATPLLAEDDAKEKKGKGNKRANKQLLNQTMKRLAKAELTDEQKEKVTAIVEKWQPKFAEISKNAAFSKEQQEKMAEARKAAMEAGKKGAEMRKAVQEAADLTDEQKEAIKKRNELQTEMNKEINAVLTDEQREKAGIKNRQRKGKKKDKKADE